MSQVTSGAVIMPANTVPVLTIAPPVSLCFCSQLLTTDWRRYEGYALKLSATTNP